MSAIFPDEACLDKHSDLLREDKHETNANAGQSSLSRAVGSGQSPLPASNIGKVGAQTYTPADCKNEDQPSIVDKAPNAHPDPAHQTLSLEREQQLGHHPEATPTMEHVQECNRFPTIAIVQAACHS